MSSPGFIKIDVVVGDYPGQPVDENMGSYQDFYTFIHNPQALLRQLQFSKEILRCNEDNLRGSNRAPANS